MSGMDNGFLGAILSNFDSTFNTHINGDSENNILEVKQETPRASCSHEDNNQENATSRNKKLDYKAKSYTLRPKGETRNENEENANDSGYLESRKEEENGNEPEASEPVLSLFKEIGLKILNDSRQQTKISTETDAAAHNFLFQQFNSHKEGAYTLNRKNVDGGKNKEDEVLKLLKENKGGINGFKKKYELKPKTTKVKQEPEIPKELKYEHHMAIVNQKVVSNTVPFECPICFDNCKENEGVTLKECLHNFCRECIRNHIKLHEEIDIKCPHQGKDHACPEFITEAEIQGLLTKEEYATREERSLSFASTQLDSAFHCKKPDCNGWCVVEGLKIFNCPVCNSQNCIECEVIHEGKTCEQYKEAELMKDSSYTNKKSEELLQTTIELGQAMRCPKCSAVVEKITGCDAIKCTICKVDLCWATKGLRWGPKGPGDTSGGCRCKVGGRPCTPTCGNCH